MSIHCHSLLHYRKNKERAFALLLGAFAFAPLAGASSIVDGDVPVLMDAGGTESSPASYIIGFDGAYNRDFGSAFVQVGVTRSWNSLLIQNGSHVSTADMGLSVGAFSGSDNNSLTVDGSTLTSGFLDVGDSGNNNRMLVRNGGSVTVGNHDVNIGYFGDHFSQMTGGGSGNELTVSGANSLFEAGRHLNVGFYGSGNRLVVEAGALARIGDSLMLSSENISAPGQFDDRNNSVLVTGAGSRLEINDGDVSIGRYGRGDSMRIEDSGVVEVNGIVWVGNSDSSTSQLVVSGDGSELRAQAVLVGAAINAYSTSTGGEHLLLVEDGALVTLANELVIGGITGKDSEVVVTGKNSVLYVDGGILLGGFGAEAQAGNNVLTVADGALVDVGFIEVFAAGVDATDNYIRLDGGYIAWYGDNLSGLAALLTGGVIQVWNPQTGQWENALNSEYFQYGYFESEEDAYDFSGYHGLAGYTIFSSVIPEPAHVALLLGSLLTAGVLAMRVRRQRVR